MVNYHCPRCGYETNHFVTFKRHLSRKKICENVLSDDNLNELYIKYNITEKLENLKSAKTNRNEPKVNKNEPDRAETSRNEPKYEDYSDESSEDEKCYKCEYCKKKFSHSQSLNRHVKNRCKVKKENEKEKNEMNKIVEMLNEQLKDKDKKIDELIKKSGTTNTTTNITYNQQNNVSNNIKLLGYRKTDISHLSDKDFINCISHSNFCIPHLIRKIHFDPNKPENHNIYISNIKNNYAMIYDGDKWNLSNRDDLINEILEEKEIIIEEKLEEWLEKGDRKYPEIMKKFTRYLEKKEHDVVLDKIKDEIKLVLFNNRNIIKNN